MQQNKLNYIGQDLFYGCSNLKEISLPSTLCALGQGCFWGCSSLESITIPYGVTFIGYYAFTDCTALKDIYYAGSESDWNEIEIGEENENLLNANIHFDFEQTHKHEYVSTVTTPATCTEPGVMTYICACGETYTDVIPATGHKWNAGKVTKKATTTATGTKKYTCTVCGKTKTTTLAKLPKKANPLAVKGKTVTVKYNKLSKKAQTLKATKVIKFTNKGKGKKTYALSTAKKGSKSFKKYFKINMTSGKVTLKKGLPKGTYKVTVKVKAAGNASYKPSAAKKVTFKVTVK